MKSLGQVGYEAMRAILQEMHPVSPVQCDDPAAQEGVDYLNGVWEAQPQKLRDDWDAVAVAIEKAVRSR